MRWHILILPLFMLTACDLAPEFSLTDATPATPARFDKAEDAARAITEAKVDTIPDGAWKAYNDKAIRQFGTGEWWKIFADPRLEHLIAKARANSPTLAAAKARRAQARAALGVAESNLYPDITANAGINRQRFSAANPFFPAGFSPKPFTLYRTGIGIDYGLDLFGRARNNARAAAERALGEEASFRAAELALLADIASAYYTLLSTHEELLLTERMHALREASLAVIARKYTAGAISDLDVARAEGELATTAAELAQLRESEAHLTHLLASLTGETPGSFRLPACALTPGDTTRCSVLGLPPVIPAGLPSSLLERRPDITLAARELAARVATIGVARAAFFPAIDLTASFGFESTELGGLDRWSNRTWLLGPATGTFLSLPIFTGGRNTANLLMAKASYREQVANYRSTVLTAFRETEDALSSLRASYEAAQALGTARAAATRAFRIARVQYREGYSDYLSQLEAERSLLDTSRSDVRARGARFVSTVTLIRALGGGWGDAAHIRPDKKSSPAAAIPAATAPSSRPMAQASVHPPKKQKISGTAAPAPAPSSAAAPAHSQPLPFALKHPHRPAPRSLVPADTK